MGRLACQSKFTCYSLTTRAVANLVKLPPWRGTSLGAGPLMMGQNVYHQGNVRLRAGVRVLPHPRRGAVQRTSRTPITLRSMGPVTQGPADTVLLFPPGTELGGPFLVGTSAVSFRGTLPATGAQTGRILFTGNVLKSG